MKNTWILVANASHAKLYSSKRPGHDLEELHTFDHPQSRHKGSDLLADRLGQRQSAVGSGTTVEQTAPKEIEAQKFALQLADLLAEKYAKQTFEKLIIVAPPHFHGLINHHLDDQVASAVSCHLEKDYTSLRADELNAHLLHAVRKHWD